MLKVRVGTAEDLPRVVEIYNHYVVNTAITFDIEPFYGRAAALVVPAIR